MCVTNPRIFKGAEMSVDIWFVQDDMEVWESNITSNILPQAKEAGVAEVIFNPQGRPLDFVEPLSKGISIIESDPSRFQALVPENKWGKTSDFLRFLKDFLEACKSFPNAEVFKG